MEYFIATLILNRSHILVEADHDASRYLEAVYSLSQCPYSIRRNVPSLYLYDSVFGLSSPKLVIAKK